MSAGKEESDIREIALVLIEDANTIMANFNGGVPEPKIIRAVFGPILRRWVHEGNFHIIQKHVGSKRINFRYRNSDSDIEEAQKKISPIWVGNLRFNDIGISMSAGAEKAPNVSNESPKETSRKAKIFFKQPICRLVNGKEYTRKDIVSFHANELGGAHLKMHKRQEQDLRSSLGFEISVDGKNIQAMLGDEIIKAKADPKRRHRIYDLADISLQDTAYVFAKGVLDNRRFIDALIT